MLAKLWAALAGWMLGRDDDEWLTRARAKLEATKRLHRHLFEGEK